MLTPNPQAGGALPVAASSAMVPVTDLVQVHELPGEREEGFNLQELWQAVRRRQRLALAVGGTVLALSTVLALYKRITAPVYEGSFQMLISDPISTGSRAGGGGGVEG
ncbi:MAG: hypothetical protein R6W06_05275, partial [Prochlorococcaceae cyanobacterium]